MRRTELGHHEPTKINGRVFQAFVPSELPPKPALSIDGKLQQLMERAVLALGRLDAVTTLLPNEFLFVYSYVRKEAVLSSQIEGTQSSLSDLLLFELDQAPGVPIDDVTEVSNYVKAMERGLELIRAGHEISNDLIREVHAILLNSGRGHTKVPGEFRTGQVWVGSWDPADAELMPPPHTRVINCMDALIRFLRSDTTELTTIARAAIAHLQFETIHPFYDGNGRVGRLLITLILCKAGVLRQPLLYLSLYLKQNRNEYYSLLTYVRNTGDWESWLDFFFRGIEVTASGAVETAQELSRRFQEHTTLIQSRAGRKTGSALRVFEALKTRPITPLRVAMKYSKLSFRAASSAMDLLTEFGIVKEITGKKRNRFFVYADYIEIINRGIETSS